MEAGCASEALVLISPRTRRNTPDDRTLEILATKHIVAQTQDTLLASVF